MAKYNVVRPGFEWRGIVHVLAEPGDGLDRAGLSELFIHLLDTLPHPGVPETTRQARVWTSLADLDADADEKLEAVVVVPDTPHDPESLARVAMREYLKMRAQRPLPPAVTP